MLTLSAALDHCAGTLNEIYLVMLERSVKLTAAEADADVATDTDTDFETRDTVGVAVEVDCNSSKERSKADPGRPERQPRSI